MPEPPRSAKLGDLLEQIEGGREVKGQARRERVEFQAPVDELITVGDG